MRLKPLTIGLLDPTMELLDETCSGSLLKFLFCLAKFEIFAMLCQPEGYLTSLKHLFLECPGLSQYVYLNFLVSPLYYSPANSLTGNLKGLIVNVAASVGWLITTN